MNLFLEEISSEDGVVYGLNTIGHVGLVLLIIITLAIMSFFVNKDGKGKLSIKQITVSGLCLALAFVLSHCKLPELPFGGSITILSMFFVTYIGYVYGPRVSMAAAFAYGFLQLTDNPKIYSVPQLICDYILAFAALGLSGFFYNKKHGMIKGYIAGVLGRYFFAVLSGVIFFAQYTPADKTPLGYSLGYNATYIVPEAVMTIVFLSIPAVRYTLKRIKMEANEKDIRKAVQLG